MLESINLFALSAARLEYLSQRQGLIARNIANANTPGYIGRDLTNFTFENALSRQLAPGGALAMTRTDANHLEPVALGGGQNARSTPAAGYDEKPDGNRVSVEEQMVKAADNTNAFAIASAAYAKSVAIMKMSIDK
jgi:flagellar basal-body rod protein FlgB